MTNPTAGTSAVTDALAAAPQGMTLAELLSNLTTVAPQVVCDALQALTAGGDVALAFQDRADEAEALLFRPADSSAPTIELEPNVARTADAIVAYLSSLTDNRGDDWPMAHPAAVAQALAKKHAPADVETAFRVAFREGLLHLIARPSNGYVSVSLPKNRLFTVLAYDRGEQQVRVFHIRAGSEAVALGKLTMHAPRLQRLTISPGRLELTSADSRVKLTPEAM